MLKIQEFINCFDSITEAIYYLKRGLDINACAVDVGGVTLYMFSPGQRSNYRDPLVRETNLLLLDENANLVAKAHNFPYIAPSADKIPPEFHMASAKVCEEVPDGETLVVYNLDGKWHVMSKGSATGEEYFTDIPGFTYQAEFKNILARRHGSFNNIMKNITPMMCLVFKYVSPYRPESVSVLLNPEAYLVGAINLADGSPMETWHVDSLANQRGLIRPRWTEINGRASLASKLHQMQVLAPGLVLKNAKGQRLAIPNPIYGAVRNAKAAGERCRPIHVAKIIQACRDRADLVSLKVAYEPLACMMDLMWAARVKAWRELTDLWNSVPRDNQKEFAQGVQHHPFNFLLFQYKDGAIHSIKDGINSLAASKLVDYVKTKWERDFTQSEASLKFIGGINDSDEEGSESEEGSIPYCQEGD